MRAEKKQLVEDIRVMIEPASGILLISYKGLNVAEFSELRTKLDEVEAECHVIPGKLFKRAAAEAGVDSLAEFAVKGDTAMVVGTGDAVAMTKAVRDFAKSQDQVSFKVGYVDGSMCSSEELTALADLPSKEVLQAQLLGVLNAPAQNFVTVLSNSVAGIARVIQAYKDKKEQAA